MSAVRAGPGRPLPQAGAGPGRARARARGRFLEQARRRAPGGAEEGGKPAPRGRGGPRLRRQGRPWAAGGVAAMGPSAPGACFVSRLQGISDPAWSQSTSVSTWEKCYRLDILLCLREEGRMCPQSLQIKHLFIYFCDCLVGLIEDIAAGTLSVALCCVCRRLDKMMIIWVQLYVAVIENTYWVNFGLVEPCLFHC